MTKMSKNLKKLQGLSKIAQIHDSKKLKTISLPLETMQELIIKAFIKL